MKKLMLASVLLASCATQKAAPPPVFTQFPQAPLEAMCSMLRAEGMTSELHIVNSTQPIVTPGAIRALNDMSFGAGGRPDPVAIQKIMTTPLLPLERPSKSCATRFVTAAEAAKTHDVMVMEFSSPFGNPFARGQTGALVRISLAGESATWYWIPLFYKANQWFAGTPASVSFME